MSVTAANLTPSIISIQSPNLIMSYVTSSQSNIAKTDLFNTAIIANTNILASDVKSSIQPSSIWLIYVSLTTPAQMQVIRTQISTNITIKETFPNISANQPVWYNILVSFAETINFQFTSPTTLLRFNASEIVPMTFHQGA